MTASLHMTVQDEGVADLMRQLSRRIKDLRRPLMTVGQIVRSSVIQNFMQEQAPSGEPWKPSLRALKQRGQTLTDTARLRNSVNVRASQSQVDVGTNVKYAGAHQFGARVNGIFRVRPHKRRISQAFGKPIKPKRIDVRAHQRRVEFTLPARPFLGVRQSDWPEIRAAISDYLLSARNV